MLIELQSLIKVRRQAAILDAIRREPVRSQEQLRIVIDAAGFSATQATLSRDIREMGLVKGGPAAAYQAAQVGLSNGQGPKVLQRALEEFLMRAERVQQMVVLHTGPGQAQPLAAALDGARLPEVVGTLAGDDTVLVVVPDVRRARALAKRLSTFAGEGRRL
jgi:transcriptional regulator of arginine metabolism